MAAYNTEEVVDLMNFRTDGQNGLPKFEKPTSQTIAHAIFIECERVFNTKIDSIY